MRCSKCGRENRTGRRFCAHCGAKLTLVCASCKAENEPGEQFCGECGEPLAEPAKPRPPPDPLSYTPNHLAEKILTTRSALEGEPRHVTVLVVDVKGLTELASELDPEEWHRITAPLCTWSCTGPWKVRTSPMLAGFSINYPVNWWLLRSRIKEAIRQFDVGVGATSRAPAHGRRQPRLRWRRASSPHTWSRSFAKSRVAFRPS
jgi:hypothetical protein